MTCVAAQGTLVPDAGFPSAHGSTAGPLPLRCPAPPASGPQPPRQGRGPRAAAVMSARSFGGPACGEAAVCPPARDARPRVTRAGHTARDSTNNSLSF